MEKAKLYILDIGHGNCSVLTANEEVVVIDAGPRTGLLEFLLEKNIDNVDLVLISHADRDHINGIISLVESKTVAIGHVRLNTDSQKESDSWNDLLFELSQQDIKGNIRFTPVLSASSNETYSAGSINIEIIAPSTYIAGRGPGSTDMSGRRLTSNSISAVIKLTQEGRSLVLLPGDIDNTGLHNLTENGTNATAPIVVFPHHGGRPGNNLKDFVNLLCETSNPEVVIFSMGRGRYGNPQPEIIFALREILPDVSIYCTQLSEQCAPQIPNEEPVHLANCYSYGREKRYCCAGTIIIDLDSPELPISPSDDTYHSFLGEYVPKALCMRD